MWYLLCEQEASVWLQNEPQVVWPNPYLLNIFPCYQMGSA